MCLPQSGAHVGREAGPGGAAVPRGPASGAALRPEARPAAQISRDLRPSPGRPPNMPENKDGEGAAAGLRPRKAPSHQTSTSQDTSPEEPPAFSADEPRVPAQRSSGTAPKGSESSGAYSASWPPGPGPFRARPYAFVAETCAWLTQPCLPCIRCYYWRPPAPRQQAWKALRVSEPGGPGLPCASGAARAAAAAAREPVPREPVPRGQCLLRNWVEERATNELDRVPRPEESEAYRYRHGHLGLLTLELPAAPAGTTHKDSYPPPGNPRKPLRGRREAMLEMLLEQQIRKEVDQEFCPPTYLNYESVTHRDYQKELDRPGPPPPTKPHCLQEQPETYWLKKASELPGVSNIQTSDNPFRKNCSFSTPVPLSMDQPLPYCPRL
ncbi:sperm-associated antigen 8 [Macrotis lagotis]|uniref:sperm-associated antigen 8 n=1 Tax=Macrotis lagotis TaxID=92651 RepID=UPI003D6979A1